MKKTNRSPTWTAAHFSHAPPSSASLSSSSSSQGWLIKYNPDQKYGSLSLLRPLSRLPLRYWGESIDLLKFNVSEIQTAYIVQDKGKQQSSSGGKRLVLGGNRRVLGVGCDGYGPSLDENITECCWKERSLVECCGEFYIVDCLLEKNRWKINTFTVDSRYSEVIHDDFGNTQLVLSIGYYNYRHTVGFKVYKMDEELGKWGEVTSYGDHAFATDACFSVSAHEFYGCLQNAIYFSDKEEEDIKMFKLDEVVYDNVWIFADLFPNVCT